MIIRTAQFGGRWNAGLAQENGLALFPSLVGHGHNQAEAIGALVLQLGRAEDSIGVSDEVDVRVIAA